MIFEKSGERFIFVMDEWDAVLHKGFVKEEEAFQNTEVFCTRFFGLLYDTIEFGEVTNVPETVGQRLYELSQEGMKSNFRTLANIISGLCQEIDRPLILMIDEVDQASNNKVFVTFLGILRDMYLKRRQRPTINIHPGTHSLFRVFVN